MTEQRVIASKPKIGARPTSGAPEPEPESKGKGEGGGSKKKLMIIVLAVVLVLGGGAAYWFLMGPGASATEAAPEPEPEPEKGEVFVIEAVSINLAGGHYLRLGMGLQLTAEVTEEPDAARALDLAIALFSGRTVEEVSSPEGREALKTELAHQLEEAYEGEVIDVYLTDYVTQ
ncbi:flagellar basal body-associated FliL family protein [Actinotalea subterranea]|uniref:flagellar basal body-associated FliL family protein n=1 Tax=Actinotalea subterranea TaxID=2607497 RepID=UPI0011EEE0B2|nr:flagellar basal body-associated FliL family protein [Actinotalea subterranea]